MNDHPYLCECTVCKYNRAIRRAILDGLIIDDPFPQEPINWQAKREQFKQAYSGGFKYSNRPKKGFYRRVYDQALDVINWQYRAWPTAKWETYYTVTIEMITTDPAPVNQMTVKYNTLADSALRERRFFKIERVDQTA